jgi:hypothetical protein
VINEYALHWAVGFLAIYLIAQLVVLKHPYFQTFSAVQKSITVKLLALIGFVVAYSAVRFLIL